MGFFWGVDQDWMVGTKKTFLYAFPPQKTVKSLSDGRAHPRCRQCRTGTGVPAFGRALRAPVQASAGLVPQCRPVPAFGRHSHAPVQAVPAFGRALRAPVPAFGRHSVPQCRSVPAFGRHSRAPVQAVPAFGRALRGPVLAFGRRMGSSAPCTVALSASWLTKARKLECSTRNASRRNPTWRRGPSSGSSDRTRECAVST